MMPSDAPARVDRDSPLPVWHQIEVALAQDIRTGRLPPGARLPSEAEFAARFGVNRHTVRRALAMLADKGAVRVRRGLGTFVEPGVIDYAISQRTRFTENLQQQNRLAAHTLLDAGEAPADPAVADALALPHGAAVIALRTLSSADGIPVSVGQTYLDAARFPDAAAAYARLRSITALLRAAGISDYRRRSSRVIAALPDEDTARLLRQSRRTPVLLVDSVDEAAGQPVCFNRTRFAGERVQLLMEPGG